MASRAQNDVYERTKGSKSYMSEYAFESSHALNTDSGKKAVEDARKLTAYIKDPNAFWWYAAGAMEDLGYDDKIVKDLTQSDWDKINAYIAEQKAKDRNMTDRF